MNNFKILYNTYNKNNLILFDKSLFLNKLNIKKDWLKYKNLFGLLWYSSVLRCVHQCDDLVDTTGAFSNCWSLKPLAPIE